MQQPILKSKKPKLSSNLIRNDIGHTRIYSVYNDSGSLLLYTSNGRMAHFVAKLAPGIDPAFRLRVGGDPGTRAVDKQGHWIRMAPKKSYK
jgi:hypothetical protein